MRITNSGPSANGTFNGHSLELENGGDVRVKANGTYTINDLRGNGGTFDTSQANATLQGTFTLEGSSSSSLSSQAAGDVLIANSNITGTGSLTVNFNSSAIQLGGTNNYRGGTTLTGGSLEILAASSLGTGNVSVTGGTLKLDGSTAIASAATLSMAASTTANLNYTGTDTVSGLTLNGVNEPAGVYGSSNSGGFLTGSGTITVAIPEPASLGLLGVAGAGVLGRRRRVR